MKITHKILNNESATCPICNKKKFLRSFLNPNHTDKKVLMNKCRICNNRIKKEEQEQEIQKIIIEALKEIGE